MLVLVAAALLEMTVPAGLSGPSPRPESIEIASDPYLREQLWTLVRDSAFGFAKTEEAAFVVREDDGTFKLIRWPGTGSANESRWRGPFPRGAVAIVHTHPNAFPQPSRIDVRTARMRNIPVYVLTRLKITKTTGGSPITVQKGNWDPAMR